MIQESSLLFCSENDVAGSHDQGSVADEIASSSGYLVLTIAELWTGERMERD